ncbi:MAG: DUF2946 domain-containing protein [Burkholderiales bacterium]
MIAGTSRRLPAWLGILAMALNALWPLLAGANPGVADPTGTQVCTANGLVWVVDGDRQLPSPDGPVHRLTPHCGFCAFGTAHAVLQSVPSLAAGAEPPAPPVRVVYLVALPPWFLSASLRSRSPPV